MERIMFAGMTPLALQTIALSDSTAIAVNSTTQTAQVLLFSVEDVDARVRMDGTSPTNNTGVCFEADSGPYILDGYNGTSVLEFCRSGSSDTSNVNIQPFKYFTGLS